MLITPLDKQCEAGDIFVIQKLNKLYTLIKLNYNPTSKYIIDIANNEFFKTKHGVCPVKYFEKSTRQDVINYLVHQLDINANDIQCFLLNIQMFISILNTIDRNVNLKNFNFYELSK